MFPSIRAGCVNLFFLCLFEPGLAGKHVQLRFDHFSSEQGLSQNSVFNMVQDNQGFMWFGTQHGLNKFDGYGFSIYKHEPFNPGSLSHSTVRFLYVQKNGALWVLTGDGVFNLFVREENRFLRLPADRDNPKTPTDRGFSAVAEDAGGRLWIGHQSGVLDCYDPNSQTFSAYRLGSGEISRTPISDLFLDGSGQFWIATYGNGLFLYNRETDGFEQFSHNTHDSESLGNNWIGRRRGQQNALYEDTSGDLWLGTGTGLSRRDKETGDFTNYPSPLRADQGRAGAQLRLIDGDGHGTIWMLYGDGTLVRFVSTTGETHLYIHNPDDPRSPSSTILVGHVFDREGVLWITSQDKGLCYYDRENNFFVRLVHDPNKPGGLANNRLGPIYEDRGGSIWIGEQGTGVSKYSPSKQKFRHYIPNGSAAGNMVWKVMAARDGTLWTGIGDLGLVVLEKDLTTVRDMYRHGAPNAGLLDGNVVQEIYEDKDGIIWIGTESNQGRPLQHGLFRLDRQTGALHPFNFRRGVLACLQGKDEKTLYIGTNLNGGLFAVNRETLEVKSLLKAVDGLVLNMVKAILQDETGVLWLATQRSGLVRYDPATGSARSFLHQPDDLSSISRNSLMDLFLDERGQLWVTTFGGGLNVFDRSKGTFGHLTRADGLANNVVYGIVEDQGLLWLSTNGGLSCYDPASGSFKNYTTSDGLQSDEFNQGAHCKTLDGELVFGGVNGFNAFFPYELTVSSTPPPINVSAVINGKRLIGEELASGSKIQLGPGDRVIEFEVAALDFTDTKRNQYNFKLDGFDPDWRQAGTRRRATYTNLNEGTYQFRVKAANSDGVFNEIALEITVAPIFYRTSWFKVALFLALIGLFLWLHVAQRARHMKRGRDALLARDLARKSEELEFARNIQLAMLPEAYFSNSRFEIAGHMNTAAEVGGDYYDFFELENGKICIAYGDATGHGVAAGLVVGMVKMATSLWSIRPEASLLEMIGDLNIALKRSLPVKGMGMCFGLALFDPRSGEVEICSSGMPHPCLFEKQSGSLRPLVLKGPPLGFIEEIPIPTTRFTLRPGDMLVILSDGLSERFNPEDKLWGDKALIAELAKLCAEAENARDVGVRLMEACDRFARERPNDDDMTVVVLRLLAGEEAALETKQAFAIGSGG